MRYSTMSYHSTDADTLTDFFNETVGLTKEKKPWDKNNLYWNSVLSISSWELGKDNSKEVCIREGEWSEESFLVRLAEYVGTNGEVDSKMYLEDVLHYLAKLEHIPYGWWIVSYD